jgi:hypothetical protein
MDFFRQVARLVVFALVMAVAVPAVAAAGTKSASATGAGEQAVVSAVATCPGGQRATGGGFKTAPASAAPFLSVYESLKSGQRSWRSSGQISDPGATNAPLSITTFVRCSRDAPKTKTKSSTTFANAGNAVFTTDARCSSGKAHAGGFSSPPPNAGSSLRNTIADSVRSGKKTWHLRWFASSSSGLGSSFTSHVYCAENSAPKARGASTVSAATGPVTAQSKPCRSGTKLRAGGFSQDVANPATPLYLFYNASVPVGKIWQVETIHVGSASTLTVTGYCK